MLLLRALVRAAACPPRLSYALWLPVLLCLLVPLRLPSAVSIRNAAPVQRVDRAVAQIASRPLVLAGWEAGAAAGDRRAGGGRPPRRRSRPRRRAMRDRTSACC